MGFRFRKTLQLFPGVRVNVSKTGTSVSIGQAGASVNVSKRGVRTTVGVPGTGLSYSQNLGVGAPDSAEPTPAAEGPVRPLDAGGGERSAFRPSAGRIIAAVLVLAIIVAGFALLR